MRFGCLTAKLCGLSYPVPAEPRGGGEAEPVMNGMEIERNVGVRR